MNQFQEKYTTEKFPVNFAAEFEQRMAERFPVVCDVEFSNGKGFTRDLSSTGVFLNTNKVLKIGEIVRFGILLQGNTVRLHCEGQVLRCLKNLKNYGVAIEFTEYDFERVVI